MSNLIYKGRSHAKTIQLINGLLKEIEFNLRQSNEVHITLNKNPMIDYHLSYLLEIINNTYKVEYSEGKLIYNLYVSEK